MGQFADIFSSRPVLADGAMGTVLYARGVFINRCYDELNLSDPNLILSIHEDYLQAGAEIIETNTFGANRFRLTRHGLASKVAEINAAGVKLAKQAVAHLKEKQAGTAYVAGSIGPLGVRLEPLGKTGLDEARAAFAEQIRALADSGVDLLIIETMPALNEAREALLAAEETAPDLPVLRDGHRRRRQQLPRRLIAATGRCAAHRMGRRSHWRQLLHRPVHRAHRD